MLCQHCGKNEATTHVKSIVNGEYTEYMLCFDCAKEMGYTSLWSDMQSDFNSLLGSFFSNALPERSQATRCNVCGCTYNDIADSGQVGCANCYDVFESEFLPSLLRIHGNTKHCGKRPLNLSADNPEKEVEQNAAKPATDELKKQLKEAVEQQNFELAAQLRDRIKQMEDKNEQ